MERGSEVFVVIRALVILQLIHKTYFCPSDQIYQNVTKSCCYPVFNCRPGNGVAFCTVNGTKDTCTPCPEGEIQPQIVSSLDGIDATCFKDDTQDDCATDEFMPARATRHTCPLHCLCNNNNCYYGYDPCRCNPKESRSCEVDMTMDILTGECVKCPKYTFKNNTGCGLCYYNETAWFDDHRKVISTVFTPLTSIGVTDESRYNNSIGMNIPIAAVIAISVVVAIGSLLILTFIFRQRLKEKCLLLCRQCQRRKDDDDPASMEDLNHTLPVDPKFKAEVKENETPVMEVRPVVQKFSGAQNAQNDEPTLDNSSCQREEPERDQTYVKEVVGSQTHIQEERQNMTTEMNTELCSPQYGEPCQQSYGFDYLKDQITEPIEAVNDHCFSDSAHMLLEESVRQREEEDENKEKEVVPLIAQ
ncbi:hypothetical protein CHS0354_020708 [Potamilus streckersoni]|uniref:Uncharacterized protein n=1 Tax=Potamilus streckersoni TaxID=2493646 RepID=A0AAE0S8G2_9BIVA|nr:hypothetical protein CHS0354_020708 [Potamilus streckersoni]